MKNNFLSTDQLFNDPLSFLLDSFMIFFKDFFSFAILALIFHAIIIKQFELNLILLLAEAELQLLELLAAQDFLR